MKKQSKKKILILGSSSYLGKSLSNHLKNFQVIQTHFTNEQIDSIYFNIIEDSFDDLVRLMVDHDLNEAKKEMTLLNEGLISPTWENPVNF